MKGGCKKFPLFESGARKVLPFLEGGGRKKVSEPRLSHFVAPPPPLHEINDQSLIGTHGNRDGSIGGWGGGAFIKKEKLVLVVNIQLLGLPTFRNPVSAPRHVGRLLANYNSRKDPQG